MLKAPSVQFLPKSFPIKRKIFTFKLLIFNTIFLYAEPHDKNRRIFQQVELKILFIGEFFNSPSTSLFFYYKLS